MARTSGVALGQNIPDVNYSVASVPWEKKYGNHGAILIIDQAFDASLLDLEWRRHDKEKKDALTLDKSQGFIERSEKKTAR